VVGWSLSDGATLCVNQLKKAPADSAIPYPGVVCEGTVDVNQQRFKAKESVHRNGRAELAGSFG
jgi:hypothetical protein